MKHSFLRIIVLYFFMISPAIVECMETSTAESLKVDGFVDTDTAKKTQNKSETRFVFLGTGPQTSDESSREKLTKLDIASLMVISGVGKGLETAVANLVSQAIIAGVFSLGIYLFTDQHEVLNRNKIENSLGQKVRHIATSQEILNDFAEKLKGCKDPQLCRLVQQNYDEALASYSRCTKAFLQEQEGGVFKLPTRG